VPKIIAGSLTEHREETRRRLFTALATLMEERGFDAISLTDIAREAGIGRTAVYNHVTDKESLLLAYITHETEQYLASLEQALEGVADPVDQLRLYIRYQLRMRRSLHMPAGLRAAVSPTTQVRLREHAAPVEALLRRILTAGIACGAFAPQPVDLSVTLINTCLSMRGRAQERGHETSRRPGPGGPPGPGATSDDGAPPRPAQPGRRGHDDARSPAPETTMHAVELFLLRAVGASGT